MEIFVGLFSAGFPEKVLWTIEIENIVFGFFFVGALGKTDKE